MLLNKLTAFNNVVATGTATCNVPIGPTYERFIFKLGGTTFTKAMIARMVFRLNGKIVFDASGSDIDKINTYSGMAVDAAYLTVDFTELYARDQVGQSIGALATANGISTFTIEVQIAGATAPTLECWAQTSAPRDPVFDANGRPLVVVEKLIPYTASFAAAGKFNIQLPTGPVGSMIKRIYLFHGGNLTDAELKKNGVVIFEAPRLVNEIQQKDNRKTPQANLYVIDAVIDWNLTEMINTRDASSFELNVFLSAGDTVRALVEYVDPLGNL